MTRKKTQGNQETPQTIDEITPEMTPETPEMTPETPEMTPETPEMTPETQAEPETPEQPTEPKRKARKAPAVPTEYQPHIEGDYQKLVEFFGGSDKIKGSIPLDADNPEDADKIATRYYHAIRQKHQTATSYVKQNKKGTYNAYVSAGEPNTAQDS